MTKKQARNAIALGNDVAYYPSAGTFAIVRLTSLCGGRPLSAKAVRVRHGRVGAAIGCVPLAKLSAG